MSTTLFPAAAHDQVEGQVFPPMRVCWGSSLSVAVGFLPDQGKAVGLPLPLCALPTLPFCLAVEGRGCHCLWEWGMVWCSAPVGYLGAALI